MSNNKVILRVLVLVPDMNNVGGVTNLFRSLNGKFKTCETIYFTRGTRVSVNQLSQQILKFTDYIRFIYCLLTQTYDLVHVNMSLTKRNLYRDPLFVLIAKLLGKKVLVFFHGWDIDTLNGLNKVLFSIVIKADAIVVLAEEFRNKLESWGYKNSIYLARTAVSKELELMLDEGRRVKKDKVENILFLTRMEVRKGIYETLLAFKLLQENNTNLNLFIGGDGSEQINVVNFIKSHNIRNVKLYGLVSGKLKAKILLDSDIYMFPSHKEGMPISVLEAMMAGLPIITRYTGGLCDFFENGKMGFITDSKDPKVFANMLSSLINNQCMVSNISEYNHNYAKDNFTVDYLVERLESIYSEICMK